MLPVLLEYFDRYCMLPSMKCTVLTVSLSFVMVSLHAVLPSGCVRGVLLPWHRAEVSNEAAQKTFPQCLISARVRVAYAVGVRLVDARAVWEVIWSPVQVNCAARMHGMLKREGSFCFELS